MKKKISLLLLAVLFLFSSQTVLAEDYLIVDRDEQSAGVETTQYTEDGSWDLFYDKESNKYQVVYNITTEAPDEVTIDLTNVLDVLSKYIQGELVDEIEAAKEANEDYIVREINGIYYKIDLKTMKTSVSLQGGDNVAFRVTINNKSGKTYFYKEGSLTISTPKNNDEESETIAFDGQKIPETPSQKTLIFGYNQLLSDKNIINSIVDEALKEFGREDRKRASTSEVNKALKSYFEEHYKEYKEEDRLKACIIDFFNKRYNTSYKEYDEFNKVDFELLLNEIGRTSPRRLGSLTYETIKYDHFYLSVFSIVITKEEEYDSKYDDNCNWASNANSEVTVGTYMNEKVNNIETGKYKETDDYLNNTLSILDNGESATIVHGFSLDGNRSNDTYQSYLFNYYASFKMTAVKHNVYVNYIDVDGKVIADQDYFSGIYSGEEYKTSAKTIEGYELVRVDGEATGVMADKDVVVTYVYEYVLGQGGDDIDPEPIVVQTGSEIDYSLMTSAFITASLIVLALRTKKKNN